MVDHMFFERSNISLIGDVFLKYRIYILDSNVCMPNQFHQSIQSPRSIQEHFERSCHQGGQVWQSASDGEETQFGAIGILSLSIWFSCRFTYCTLWPSFAESGPREWNGATHASWFDIYVVTNVKYINKRSRICICKSEVHAWSKPTVNAYMHHPCMQDLQAGQDDPDYDDAGALDDFLHGRSKATWRGRDFACRNPSLMILHAIGRNRANV